LDSIPNPNPYPTPLKCGSEKIAIGGKGGDHSMSPVNTPLFTFNVENNQYSHKRFKVMQTFTKDV
jgi:hypothetical protein